jgi:hypothetical protein
MCGLKPAPTSEAKARTKAKDRDKGLASVERCAAIKATTGVLRCAQDDGEEQDKDKWWILPQFPRKRVA